MAEYLIQDTTLIEIANAIRNKSEKTEPIPVSNFAKEINSLEIFNGTPPVLDSTLPADASFITGESVTCHVLILEASDEEEYRYQWYVNNTAVIGATQSSHTITSNTTGTITVYCNVSNSIGTTSSRVATITVKSATPSYTYGGTATLTNEGNNNWNLQLKTSGTLKFTELGNAANGIEVFLVGGGGAGGKGNIRGGGGGGGGYTKTGEVLVDVNTKYSITIGGGSGITSAFSYSANPGGRGGDGGSFEGGNGAGGGGTGIGGGGGSFSAWNNTGSGGGNGSAGAYAFGDTNYAQYGGGGGGGGGWMCNGGNGGAGGGGHGVYGGGNGGGGSAGSANTGGGGGGGGYAVGGHSGGSGIVIIRNKRS